MEQKKRKRKVGLVKNTKGARKDGRKEGLKRGNEPNKGRLKEGWDKGRNSRKSVAGSAVPVLPHQSNQMLVR